MDPGRDSQPRRLNQRSDPLRHQRVWRINGLNGYSQPADENLPVLIMRLKEVS